MAFDGLETALENNRLARRLTGQDIRPVDVPVLPPEAPEIQQLAAAVRAQKFEELIDQPLGRHMFRAFLRHDHSAHFKLDFLADVVRYHASSDADRSAVATNLFNFFFGDYDDSGIAEAMQEATEPNEIVVSLSSIFSASGSSLHAHHEPDGAEKPHAHHGDQNHHDHPGNQPHGAHGADDAAAAHPGVSSRDSERSADGDGKDAAAANVPRRHVKALSRDEFEMKKLMKIGKCRLASAPRPLVKQAARAVQTEPCPKDAFDALAEQFRLQLLNDHFPKFLASPEFMDFIRHKHFAARGSVELSDFTLFRTVGKGAFGAVSAVSRHGTNALYAMKEMNKKQIVAEDMVSSIMNERNILAELDSPFVTKLVYAFQNEQHVYLIMPFCSGGDLRWHMKHTAVQSPRGRSSHFPPAYVRFWMGETLLGLEHVHSRHIVYRDLKPHNLLLTSKGHVMLSDFGLAEKALDAHGRPVKMDSLTGTPCFWAPECLMRIPYSYPVDMWSFGVLLYTLLSGQKPTCSCGPEQWCTFLHSDEKTQESRAENEGLASYNPMVRYPSSIDPIAGDLIARCLRTNPESRITLAEAKQHAFFNGLNWSSLQHMKTKPPYIPEAAEIHAESIADVGDLNTSKYRKVKMTQQLQRSFEGFDYYDEMQVQKEIADALRKQFERFGSRHSPQAIQEGRADQPAGCCAIL